MHDPAPPKLRPARSRRAQPAVPAAGLQGDLVHPERLQHRAVPGNELAQEGLQQAEQIHGRLRAAPKLGSVRGPVTAEPAGRLWYTDETRKFRRQSAVSGRENGQKNLGTSWVPHVESIQSFVVSCRVLCHILSRQKTEP